MPLHVSSTCAHHQEVKIALHSLRYHHTYRCDDTETHGQQNVKICTMVVWQQWGGNVGVWLVDRNKQLLDGGKCVCVCVCVCV